MQMDPQLYTEKAREALASAQRVAEERHHPQLEPEHVLSTLLGQSDGVVPRILEHLNTPPDVVAREAEQAVTTFPVVTGATAPLSLSPRLRIVLERGQEEAH